MRPEPVVTLSAVLRQSAPSPPMHERVAYELARLRIADTREIRSGLEHLRRMHD